MKYPAMTVNQLKDFCDIQIEKGNGDKKILISADDEGNGYHGLFYEFIDKKEDIKLLSRYFHDNVDVNEIVILG